MIVLLNLTIFLLGLCVFLLGLFLLKKGLGLLNNAKLKRIIYGFTKRPSTGCLVGTLLTFLVQSSSAVSVITIGMVDGGIMTFAQALGIILGTNIGTTITGQLMAFDLEAWGLPLVVLGILLMLLTKRMKRFLGLSIVGLGLVFIGMDIMGTAFNFIKDYPLFYELLHLTNSNSLFAVIFGLISTAIIQSSSALIGIVLVLAKNQQLDLVAATAIVLGSNIGTCFTAVLASIGSTTGGKRVAMAHVVLNVLGVLFIYPFLVPFTDLMALTSNSLPRQIAHASTIFNILNSLVVLPFANLFANFIIWLVPDKDFY